MLESIKTYVPDHFEIDIIYTWSNEKYKEAYDKLIKISDSHIQWVIETRDLQTETEFLINQEKNNHICFSTDDMVFWREPEGLAKLPEFDHEVFSYRLGQNTVVQDCHRRTFQPPLCQPHRVDCYVGWDIRGYHPLHNYGYPLALDTHVFTKRKFLELSERFVWNNTNSLESGLHKYSNETYIIYSYETSTAVNIPANNMSRITIAGQEFGYTTSFLNDLFLEGKKISLAEVSKQKIIGCHQEMPYVFIGRK